MKLPVRAAIGADHSVPSRERASQEVGVLRLCVDVYRVVSASILCVRMVRAPRMHRNEACAYRARPGSTSAIASTACATSSRRLFWFIAIWRSAL